MGDIKLIAGIHDRLRLLVEESRAKIDLFALRWGELAGKVPRNYLLGQFDGFANVLTNINAEVRCRKFASLHGYEYSRFGKLSFEEVQRNLSYKGNINSIIKLENNIVTPDYYLSDSKFVQKGNQFYNASQNNSMMNAGRFIEQ
jgi:hypothetical protein